MYLQNSDPMNSMVQKARELGLNASAGHTIKFLGCTWNETKFGKESEILAPSVEERTPEETSRQEDCARKAAWSLAK